MRPTSGRRTRVTHATRAVRSRWGALACLGLLVAGPLSGQSLGERLPVERIELENGLRVLLLPRAGAPTVSFVVRYSVGGVHEHLGTTGVAHLLEHLLFKGTTSVGTRNVEAERELFGPMDAAHDTLLRARAEGDSVLAHRLRTRIDQLEDSARTFVVPNEFDRILTRAGAQGLNATTTNDATIYFVELPANRAELWFVLEADRVANPVFREFYTERNVVAEERRLRIETNPAGLLYEAHLATAFEVHPYGVPVVGYMSDIESLNRNDVRAYFKQFYRPNNAVVAIVGDIDPERIRGWVREYLAPLPRGETPPPVLTVEAQQRGERRVRIGWEAEPALRVGWRVPSALDDDAPALAILSSILTGGRTSRLYRRLVVDERLATGVYSSIGPGSLYPRLFQIDATPLSPHTTEEVEAAIYEELELLAREPPDDDELERVRNQLEAGEVRRLESGLAVAFQLAESEAVHGDWRETFRSSERLAAVTPEDVRRVAGRYFVERRRTVATLFREGGR